MAKLGTSEHPVVVRLKTMERVSAVAKFCEEQGWHYIAGIEPDKPEDFSDLKFLLDAEQPTLKVGRNDPCPCGSKKKFKKCCLDLPSPGMKLIADVLAKLPEPEL